MVSQGVLECPGGGWSFECGCPVDHNYCWPRPDTRCCDRLLITDETPPDEAALIERMLRMSVEILHGMSGRQFGLCSRTIRPCKDDCGAMARPVWGWAANGGLLEPMLDGGKWYNAICGQCVSDCSCGSVCEVSLPALVQRVVQVRLDGVVLDPETYRVDNRRKLVRLGATIVPAPEVVTVLDGNMFDAATRYCFPVDVLAPEGLIATADPTPPFCFTVDPNGPGQQVVFADGPDCHLFTVDVALADSGRPVVLVAGGGIGTFVFTPQNLTAGQSATSAWKNDLRLKIRYVSGASADLSEFGSLTLVDGSSTIEACFERRVFGDVVDCWPTCQDMSKPATEPGTFEVTYLRGKPVPEYGLWAAGLLACELIKACAPAGDDCGCKLPSNVQSVVREGVSIDMEAFVLGGGQNAGFGRTGIPEVDLWLATVNPAKLTSRSRAYSPDKRTPRRTTWPCADD